jgi:uncharacterized protein YdaU (DUF1376 family)
MSRPKSEPPRLPIVSLSMEDSEGKTMHYYSFHVSDYIHDTAHLSNDEDLAYRRILDLYYTQEHPIPNKTQEVSRRIRMASQADVVSAVLEEFFTFDKENDCWFHKRCDETIAAYQAKAERNRIVGKLGGRPKANPKETQMVSKSNPNHKPITNNHKPIKNTATVVATPVGVSQEVWDSFVAHRKSKKAQVTKMVIDGIQKEADKAGVTLEDALREIVVRNWQSFKAEWFQPKIEHISAKQTNKSFFERDQELKRKRWEEMTGEKWPENDRKAIIEASNFLELK